jgi:hypothetical protein
MTGARAVPMSAAAADGVDAGVANGWPFTAASGDLR